nr:hypothetical protein GCM10025699_02930 [Microbacterium flavescens]
MIGAREPAERLGHGCEGRAGVFAEAVDRVVARRVLRQELHGHASGAEGDGCRGLGQLVGTGRELERAASDVEEQDLPGRPAEPAADGEERVPRLGLTAEHLQRLSERLLDEGDHRRPVGDLADGGRRRREQFVDVLGCRDPACVGHRRHERVHALRRDLSIGAQVAHEAQDGPPARRRERTPARADIGDEQMDGVRTDVEDSQAHGSTVPVRVGRRRACAHEHERTMRTPDFR